MRRPAQHEERDVDLFGELLGMLLLVCSECGTPYLAGHSWCRYCQEDDHTQPCRCESRRDKEGR